MVVSCSRWFGFRLDLLSSVFITIVAGTAILITENSGEFRQYVPLYEHGHVVLRVLCAPCFLLKRSYTMPVKAVEVCANELTEPHKTEN